MASPLDIALAAHRREAAVVTAVHVARDWAIEQHGNRYSSDRPVKHYMRNWLVRNGASNDFDRGDFVVDLVEAVWALAELPAQDPLTLMEDTWQGTREEAHEAIKATYERDLAYALNRITWKD